MLDILKPADIAALLESSPPHERGVIWNLIDSSRQSEILQELNEERVSDLLADLPENEIIQLLDNVEADDDLTDILQQLPDTVGVHATLQLGGQPLNAGRHFFIVPDNATLNEFLHICSKIQTC